MWFLQVDILVRFLGSCIAFALLAAIMGLFGKQRKASSLLLLADIGLIAYVSRELAIFYVAYLIVTFVFLKILAKNVTRGAEGRRPSKALFAILCLACTAPFFYAKLAAAFSGLPQLLVLVGLSYNMLKAIDALYFEYYAETSIPFLLYANYLLFFPVLTAGPIFRYRDFKRTFENPSSITAESVTLNVQRFIRGMFKKVVAAAVLATVLTRLTEAAPCAGASAAAAAVSYLLLWMDMAGYADIAISMGGLMGFTVPENFKHPLKASSFTMFWRNWHVSLSDWIKEHIFVVMNGKRLTRLQGAAIGFCTMMIMALWHEISMVFIIDGFICGTVLAAENLLGLTTVDRKKPKPYVVFRCFLTNAIFAVTTLFFTLPAEELLETFKGFLIL